MFLFVTASVARPVYMSCFESLHLDLPETEDATEDDGDLVKSTVSVQLLMRGIELEWSYRSNVPAARGVSWVFFSCHGLGLPSGLLCKTKTPGTSGMRRQSCSVYWASYKLHPMKIKDLPALRQGPRV
jgi:hypothetical protein